METLNLDEDSMREAFDAFKHSQFYEHPERSNEPKVEEGGRSMFEYKSVDDSVQQKEKLMQSTSDNSSTLQIEENQNFHNEQLKQSEKTAGNKSDYEEAPIPLGATTLKIPRKDWRVLKKKQRKKATRIEQAKIRQHQQMEKNQRDALSEDILKKFEEAEERKRNAQRILWEVRERQIDQANAERKRKKEEDEKRKKIIQDNWAKAVQSIKPIASKLLSETVSGGKSFKTNNQFELQASGIKTSPINSEYGTEKDQLNCSFYLKTGACRYGDVCDRYHPYPEKSFTLMIKNMYEGMPVQLADEENDDNLEYDEEEAERHYFEFFEDTHSEFLAYGNIIQFKVCKNFQIHLRGNVYVQYEKEEEAERALEAIRGRWYAGKQLIADYSPVTKWKGAICGFFERNKCPRGMHCNFLHVFKNPGGLYSDADRDNESVARRHSDSIGANSPLSNNLTTPPVNPSISQCTDNNADPRMNSEYSDCSSYRSSHLKISRSYNNDLSSHHRKYEDNHRRNHHISHRRDHRYENDIRDFSRPRHRERNHSYRQWDVRYEDSDDDKMEIEKEEKSDKPSSRRDKEKRGRRDDKNTKKSERKRQRFTEEEKKLINEKYNCQDQLSSSPVYIPISPE
ncbi:hypothetical protein G9A89_004099 [Geosiphon pyriformis]|nr:hypothetical protein G9A89_004099 [Geosiphon pyriformis]